MATSNLRHANQPDPREPGEPPAFDPGLLREMDPGEWTRLVETTQRKLRAIISMLAPWRPGWAAEDQEAYYEDLVQDTYARALQYMTWDGTTSIQSWLNAIARNVARDQYDVRKKGVTVVRDESDETAPRVADDAVDALTQLTGEETYAQLAREVDRLPDRQRVAFKLHAVDGLSHEEAGQRVDASPESMQRAYSVARRKLQSAATRILEDR